MQLANTSAVVTGAASGLGEATARFFAEKGATVTLLDRDEEKGEAVAAEIGGTFVQTDVTDEASVQNAIDTAMDRMGRITATVNCAGIAFAIKTLGRDGPHPFDAFRKTLDVNLAGTFNVSRLAAAAMAQNEPEPDGARGVIVNTASVAAFDGQKGQAAYSASKGGVVGMTLPMARDGMRRETASSVQFTRDLAHRNSFSLLSTAGKSVTPKGPWRYFSGSPKVAPTV